MEFNSYCNVKYLLLFSSGIDNFNFVERLLKITYFFLKKNSYYQANLSSELIELSIKNKNDPMFENHENWAIELRKIYKQSNNAKVLADILRIEESQIQKSLVHKIDYMYRSSFIFAKHFKKYNESKNFKVICIANKTVRNIFKEMGYRISFFSYIHWLVYCLYEMTSSFIVLLKLNLNLLKDLVSTKNSNSIAADTVWIGLRSSEIVKEKNKMNVAEFIETRKFQLFQTSKIIYLHSMDGINQSPHSMHISNNIYAGKKLFSYLKFSKSKIIDWFSVSFHATKIWLSMSLRIILGNSNAIYLISESILLPKIKKWIQLTKIKNIIVTNSWMRNQPMWFAYSTQFNFKINLFYYSSRHSTICHKSEPYYRNCEPMEEFSFCTDYYVWNEEMKNVLNKDHYKTNESIHVVGPLIMSKWPTISEISRFENTDIPVIAVFDVVPVENNMMSKVYGRAGYYYYGIHMPQFLSSCLMVARETFGHNQFKILFKSKKTNKTGVLKTEYFDFLDQFVKEREVIVIDPNTSPIQTVLYSHLVISPPFSTTSDLGNELKRPSCFFDVTGDIQDMPRIEKEPVLISSNEALSKWMRDQMMELKKNEKN